MKKNAWFDGARPGNSRPGQQSGQRHLNPSHPLSFLLLLLLKPLFFSLPPPLSSALAACNLEIVISTDPGERERREREGERETSQAAFLCDFCVFVDVDIFMERYLPGAPVGTESCSANLSAGENMQVSFPNEFLL